MATIKGVWVLNHDLEDIKKYCGESGRIRVHSLRNCGRF